MGRAKSTFLEVIGGLFLGLFLLLMIKKWQGKMVMTWEGDRSDSSVAWGSRLLRACTSIQG